MHAAEQLGKEIKPTRDEIKSGACSRWLSPVIAKREEKHETAVHNESPCISGFNSRSQCNNYIISRAFIPPWSLVMTRPETLGPDASVQRGRNPSFLRSVVPDVFLYHAPSVKRQFENILFQYSYY